MMIWGEVLRYVLYVQVNETCHSLGILYITENPRVSESEIQYVYSTIIPNFSSSSSVPSFRALFFIAARLIQNERCDRTQLQYQLQFLLGQAFEKIVTVVQITAL